ncbi:formate dehydrogenase subunit alpha [Candidatus Spongiihabitans sp.]|uniref:formate dehydrogenase subunit alpha n=1 Tax=Candidatus Spongiihabitans sp. TaxID=3101308 RepID=UPI003C7A7ED1
MNNTITFTLDGKPVEACAGESIWQVAQRSGVEIPHLCYAPQPDYRADGNCRVCMVEIEGERVLAASCLRQPSEGMVVSTTSTRAKKSRDTVMELLLTDQPTREVAHEHDSRLWQWADAMAVHGSRFEARAAPDIPAADTSHPAMHVALDACIQCNLCVRACREVQVNDVIGMAFRGHNSKIVFDMDDAMGASTCVACGECVQVCPTGALMEATLVDENGVGKFDSLADPLTETDSVCPYCGVGCQITYQVADNEIIAVQGKHGPANRNRLCVKGRFGFDYVKHPHRLTKPLIRVDKNNKVGDIDLDPSNPLSHFREASWDEALDFAAGGLKKIRDGHDNGGNALAGFGSAKCTNEEAYIFQKLVRTGFGTNNVDHCTRLCHASSVAALLEGVGSGAVSAPFNTVEDADCVLVIGANPVGNHPVAATFFKQAAKHGTLIVMDPRGTALKRHATHMLQFNPGTDVALLNGILHTIIEENLYDQHYVEQHTEGFENLKKHIADFSPEKMQSICGIDAETLRLIARTFSKAKAAIIFWGMGISQHVHGTDNARCLIALSLITGQIGRPGTGLHPLRGQNNVQGASDAGLIPMMLPDYQLVEVDNLRARFEDAWGAKLAPQAGLTVVEIMDAIHDDKISGMYIMGENPAMSDPDVQHARDALAKLDHLVVQDLFLTETAFYADVVLPASAWPEKDGTVTNTNRQVQMGRSALELPGDTRQDWWITQEIAKRLDLDWNYSHPRDIFTEMTGVMPSLNNISWDRLAAESAVTYPCDAADKPGNDIVFENGFPTANQRGKLIAVNLVSPDELPDDEYPMILSTGRQLEHWHTGSMTRRTKVLDQIEPEAIATISPQALRDLKVAPGAKIRVSTRRGVIELIARADTAVPDNMIFIPFCYAEAAANTLTNPALDPVGKIPEFKFCAARVEAA